jgi:hypothetical protein
LKISRRKFICIGSLSALAFGVSAPLLKPRDYKPLNSSGQSTEHAFQPTWLQGNPHLGCSYPYFHRSEPTMENRWLEMVHFHMEPNLRDSIIYGIPHKR